MSRGTLDPAAPVRLSPTGLSPSSAGFPKTVWLGSLVASAVRTPGRSRPGLGSFHFARRYSGNHCCFLFLRLLRCFSSPGSPPCVMDSRMDARGLPARVSPFRHLRIVGRVPLPAAFRSLPRLSSAPSARASALRPFFSGPSRRPLKDGGPRPPSFRIALRVRGRLFVEKAFAFPLFLFLEVFLFSVV